jgi:hypothetical protein
MSLPAHQALIASRLAHSMASNVMTRIDEEQPEENERHGKDARRDD